MKTSEAYPHHIRPRADRSSELLQRTMQGTRVTESRTCRAPKLPKFLSSVLKWPCGLLGFALGGFFDDILLCQILKWQHLLSNVEAANDMRLQILDDGLFQALMYVFVAIALGAL